MLYVIMLLLSYIAHSCFSAYLYIYIYITTQQISSMAPTKLTPRKRVGNAQLFLRMIASTPPQVVGVVS